MRADTRGIEFAPYTIHKNAYEISAAAARRGAAAGGTSGFGNGRPALVAGLYARVLSHVARRAGASQSTSDYLSELARLCRDLGGSVLVLGSPQQRNLLPGVTHDAAMQYAADVIRRSVPVLEACGVTLAVEPLGPAEGDFLLTADLGRQLIDLVGSPHCRLHLDVKAMSTEGQPIDQIIRRHASWLQHFHANDANRRGPGMGDIDFVPILRALQEVGYQGWVSVEVFDYTPGVESLARDSITYLQACLDRLSA